MLDNSEKVLTFRLGRETYGVDILRVREIVGRMPITALPDSGGELRGVINLRGRIIPVLDMHRRFGLPEAAEARENCIITAEMASPQGPVLAGMLVDSVDEVLSLAAAPMEAVPELGGGVKQEYLKGLSRQGDKVIILLDLEHLSAATAPTE
jgi:purine-binding chemotaxis protein CheW